MVYVSAGEFVMGANDLENARPAHRVYLDAYYIYKHPVTVAQYQRFCEAAGRSMPDPPRWGWIASHPIVRVSCYDAVAYANWAHVFLPTEAQWEKAARGTDGRNYPWGNDWDLSRYARLKSNTSKSTEPVGSYPNGASPYGALDMAGNVWEWCIDSYLEYDRIPPTITINPWVRRSDWACVHRGGSWRSGELEYARCAGRAGWDSKSCGDQEGFRCSSSRPD